MGQRQSCLRVVAEMALDGGLALRAAPLFGATLESLIVTFVVQLSERVRQLVRLVLRVKASELTQSLLVRVRVGRVLLLSVFAADGVGACSG